VDFSKVKKTKKKQIEKQIAVQNHELLGYYELLTRFYEQIKKLKPNMTNDSSDKKVILSPPEIRKFGKKTLYANFLHTCQ
ncbi:MAG: translation initiation factor eIF-2 beta subunit, partial [Marteilia pararefringens]